MIPKKIKLLSFSLCLSMTASAFVYAEPERKQLNVSMTSCFNYGTRALQDVHLSDSDSSKNTYETTFLGDDELESGQHQTFQNYFPDPTLASKIASYLHKTIEDTVTLEELSTITNLNISSCSIYSLEGIECLINLQYLDAGMNRITELPESFGQLINLRELWIGNNLISKLPDSFGNLASMERLYLYNNKLTELPNSIGQLSNLKEFWGYLNQLTELPDSIGQLSSLTHLIIKFNKLTKLPDSIGQLSDLIILDANGNQLTEIPDSIGELSNLNSLSIPQNKISNLPDSIGNLSNLVYFRIYKNQLTELPDSIGQLSNLEYLDLAINQLTELPDSLNQLSELRYIALYNNGFTSLPAEVLNRSRLSVHAQNQFTSLDDISTSKPSEITYETLLSPLILQTKESNNGTLAGTWKIVSYEGITTTLEGGDGSEILLNKLFDIPGKYTVTFEWTSKEPYPGYVSLSNSALNFCSQIDIIVEKY